MVYLGFAILSSAAISLLMRLSDRYIHNNMVMFAGNYTVCGLLSLVFLFAGGENAYIKGNSAIGGQMSFAIALGIISGVFYLLSFMLLQHNIQKNGVMLAATFMKLGVLVPVIMSLALGWDQPRVFQILGCVLAVVAIIIINKEGKIEKSGGFAGYLLVLLLLVGGFTDSLSNIYDKLGSSDLKNMYLLLVFLSATIVSVIAAFIQKQHFTKTDALWGALIGIPNYFSARFLLYALAQVPAIVAYPVYNISVILIVSVLGFILFKEKFTTGKVVGMAVIIISIVFLNI